MLETGCGCLQVHFFMLTSGFTAPLHLVRKQTLMEIISSECFLYTFFQTLSHYLNV